MNKYKSRTIGRPYATGREWQWSAVMLMKWQVTLSFPREREWAREKENSFKIDHFERLTRLHLRSRPTFPYTVLQLHPALRLWITMRQRKWGRARPSKVNVGALFNSSRVIHSLRLNGDYAVHFHISSIHYKLRGSSFLPPSLLSIFYNVDRISH